MNAASSKLKPRTSESMTSVTSSPASAPGPTPFAPQAGQTIARSGREAARASRSAPLARSAASPTNVTSGLSGPSSSRSVALTSSLASRLQTGQLLNGSTLFEVIWKETATPSGRSIFALRASALRTSDNDCTGWPTPGTGDAKSANPSWQKASDRHAAKGQHKQMGLRDKVHLLSGYRPSGLNVTTGRKGQLNPGFVRWLMGLPIAWDESAPTATRSLRRSPKRS